jgi:hypothetical protein
MSMMCRFCEEAPVYDHANQACSICNLIYQSLRHIHYDVAKKLFEAAYDEKVSNE